MSIKIECPVFKGAFAAPEEAAGHQVSCPKCGQQMLIPAPSEATQDPAGLPANTAKQAPVEQAAGQPAGGAAAAASGLADLMDEELTDDPLGSPTSDPLGVTG